MKWNPRSWVTGWLLQREITQWSDERLIQPDQAELLSKRYEPCCAVPVRRFGHLALYAMAMSAIVLALAVVLIDRWRMIAPLIKITLILLLMVLAHGAGYWYRFHMRNAARGDALFLTGSILFACGAGIVSDAAQVPEFHAWSFFVAAAGILPLAWVLNSWPLLAMANLFGTAWFVTYILISGDATYTSLFVAQALCMLRWSYLHGSRSLFVMTLLSLGLWWVMLAVAEELGGAGLFWIAALGPILSLVGMRHDPEHEFTSTYKNIGQFMTAAILLPLAMPSVSRDLMSGRAGLCYWLIAIAAAGAVLAFLPGPRRVNPRREWPQLAALGTFTLIPAILGIASAELPEISQVSAIILASMLSAIVVALSVALMLYGISKECRGAVALSLLYFAVWMVFILYDRFEKPAFSALFLAIAAAGILLTTRLRFREQAKINEAISTESV